MEKLVIQLWIYIFKIPTVCGTGPGTFLHWKCCHGNSNFTTDNGDSILVLVDGARQQVHTVCMFVVVVFLDRLLYCTTVLSALWGWVEAPSPSRLAWIRPSGNCKRFLVVVLLLLLACLVTGLLIQLHCHSLPLVLGDVERTEGSWWRWWCCWCCWITVPPLVVFVMIYSYITACRHHWNIKTTVPVPSYVRGKERKMEVWSAERDRT